MQRLPLTSAPPGARIRRFCLLFRDDTAARPLPQLSLHTQAGAITLSEEDGAIVSLDWGWARDQDATVLLRRGKAELHAYFDGELETFDLPLAPPGTPYRRRVWDALRAIPYGATRSYADIVARAGGSPRSVGQANAANPIPIIIPCHRVVGSDGLGGYSGGDGLATKRLLLSLEQDRVSARGSHSHGDRLEGAPR